MKMVQDEIRKGPWTEQEDILLINFVHLFGDRRWDFIAKVSGLNRTGKSCRLRWVNYLHPGLKRGKMTPQEEKLVLELHAKWGNRWSRIARKLPGRTDNEIKNYWRTHMRKKAQERKRAMSPSQSSSNSSTSSNITTVNSPNCPETGDATTVNSFPETGDATTVNSFPETGKASFYDTGGASLQAAAAEKTSEGYSMDDIWKDIENNSIEVVGDGFREKDHSCNISCPSPPWEYYPDTLWRMEDEEEESKNFLPFEYGTIFLTG